MVRKKRKLAGSTLVAGCSGCIRGGGQMAHDLALGIADDGFAAPVCLSAIGAGYEQDITAAQHAGEIIIIDGCTKRCARNILEKAVGRPMVHACVLSDMGMLEEGAHEKDGFLIADLKRKIKIRYAQNRMLMSSMCNCGCVRG